MNKGHTATTVIRKESHISELTFSLGSSVSIEVAAPLWSERWPATGGDKQRRV